MKRRTFVKTLLFSSGAVFMSPQEFIKAKSYKNPIRISMIYNNTGKHSKLESAWGLSIWVETQKEAILFDTGGDLAILDRNLASLGFDIERLTKVFISHRHQDHLNGLDLILRKSSKVPDVYVVENDFSIVKKKFPNAKLVKILKAQQIDPDIWTTGQLINTNQENMVSEHSLLLIQNNSVVILTGCSHSGIVEMVNKTKKIFPDKTIELVAGGFHLINKPNEELLRISNELKNFDVQKIAPSHCTGDMAIKLFREQWEARFVELNLGDKKDI